MFQQNGRPPGPMGGAPNRAMMLGQALANRAPAGVGGMAPAAPPVAVAQPMGGPPRPAPMLPPAAGVVPMGGPPRPAPMLPPAGGVAGAPAPGVRMMDPRLQAAFDQARAFSR